MDLRRDLYLIANKDLIAKAIGELFYEELISPIVLSEGIYELKLSEVTYRFNARETIWSSLEVDSNTIERTPKQSYLSAAQFFLDTKSVHQMSDITLGNFLEELNATLSREVVILERNESVNAEKLLEMNETDLQSHLCGHPKILLNKGRLGWGQEDSKHYSPEVAPRFKLHWVALKRERATMAFSRGIEIEHLLSESMDESEISRFNKKVTEQGAESQNYVYLPVHPWQWDHVISIQFTHEFYERTLIDLGVFGDDYAPQVSLRTLTNISRPSSLDIKLPLTILNTSAIRGLPLKYVKAGVALSDFIEEQINQDSLLSGLRMNVLKERAGIAYSSEHFEMVKGAPYRYHEYLGATWRESAPMKAKRDFNARSLMTGALLFVDSKGNSLIEEIIKRSGLDPTEWMSAYFKHVVTPLYHLQVKHGLGLVSHGQNIVLILNNYKPSGVFIKDFGGDLRLAQNFKAHYKDIEALEAITSLPPNYLIHDLYTGHFITTLRYLSGLMNRQGLMAEADFYQIAGRELKRYIDENPIGEAPNILAPTFERVLINAVRFEIGYGDSASRPVPKLGSALKNPLAQKDEEHSNL